MELREVQLDELEPDPVNARKHSNRNIEEIARSLREFGQHAPLVVQKGTNKIIVGNGRYEAMQMLGWDKAYVVYVDDDNITAVRRALADNRTAELAEWDDETLVELLSSLGDNADVPGWNERELNRLLSINALDNVTEDEVPDIPSEATTKLGDLWILGKHRLLCGDCTKEADVLRLTNGIKIDSIVTDPPYGVDYGEKMEYLGQKRKDILNDNISDYRSFFSKFLKLAPMAEYNTVYVFISGKELLNLLLAFQDSGFYKSTELVWVKNAPILGRQDYNNRHELIVYGWKGKHKFYGAWEGTVIDETEIDLTKLKKTELIELARQLLETRNKNTTVIYENKPTKSDLHPTMKPVKLLARLIRDGSDKNALIYDPFGGSGSTLIACQQLNRACYMMELDPKYCDVIIKRWELFTGDKAILDVKGDGNGEAGATEEAYATKNT